jgi:hypothetical protein
LVTPQGLHVIKQPPKLVDEAAERKDILAKLGTYLDMVDIAYNDILVLKYIPEKIGSLQAAAETQNEQRWQNKCGLVLKYGPTAKDDGFKYEAGDWVYYRPNDGQEIALKCENDPRMAICLILSPAHVIGRVSNPDLIW